jgi:hypothetical protein
MPQPSGIATGLEPSLQSRPEKEFRDVAGGESFGKASAPQECVCLAPWSFTSGAVQTAGWSSAQEHSSNSAKPKCKSSVSDTAKNRRIRAQAIAVHSRNMSCRRPRPFRDRRTRHTLSATSAISTHKMLRMDSISVCDPRLLRRLPEVFLESTIRRADHQFRWFRPFPEKAP